MLRRGCHRSPTIQQEHKSAKFNPANESHTMTAIRISNMTGIRPRLSPRLLSESEAQDAVNCLFSDGAIAPIYGKKHILDLPGKEIIKSAFRIYDSSGNDFWLRWSGDVDVAKAPVAGDASFRIVYTSDQHEPRITNLAMATSGTSYPASCFVLGVAKPVTAPTVAASGGTAANENRAYVYTFRAYWQDGIMDESAPSPVSAIITGKPDGIWAVSGMDLAPKNSGSIVSVTKTILTVTATFDSVFGLRASECVTISGVTGMTDLNGSHRISSVNAATNQVTFSLTTDQTYTAGGAWSRDAPHNTALMKKAIYRSVVTGTAMNYFYAGEVDVSSTTFNDTATVVIGEALPSDGWEMPPADMRSIACHPSGFMIGLSGNMVCMSEPLAIYAYPTAYQSTLDYPGVSLGIVNQTVVVGTRGIPYWGAGVTPESFSFNKVNQKWPCLSKRSMVAMSDMVVFACPSGLAGIDQAGQAALLTESFYTQIEWETLSPDTFISGVHDGRYYACYETGTTGGMWMFGKGVNSKGSDRPQAIFSDLSSGKMYLVVNNMIYEWMGDIGTRLQGVFHSKEFVIQNPENFGAAKIDADFGMSEAELIAAQALYLAAIVDNQNLIATRQVRGALNSYPLGKRAVNGSAIKKVSDPAFSSIGFIFYANGEAIFSKEITNSKVFRLPMGYKTDVFSVKVSGNVRKIHAILIGNTPLSLKQV